MEPFAKETIPVNLEDEMKRSYLDYAMSVIVGRALPDVRDGLKPVHRRVLFAMHELGNDWNKAYKKSARVVGDVIGKYHPHGDVAVYDTIVRMAQDFSLRYMLIDGQGNFGSVDGDAPAAMRYTEIRMSRIAHEMLADLEKETVDFVANYDGSEKEPVVLPAKLPNLLINGSAGIAVGMATNIPPHNLVEVVNACVALIDDSTLGVEELLQHVPGPDFPTAGIIHGVEGIQQAYRTEIGRASCRERVEISVGAVSLKKKEGIRDVAVTGVQTCALPISATRARAGLPDRGHHSRRRGHPAGLSHRARKDLRERARQHRDRGEERPPVDYRNRAAVPGEQGEPAREDRRAGKGRQDRGHLRAARRVGQIRHAHGDRAEAQRGVGGDFEQPLRAYGHAQRVRCEHGCARERPTARAQPEGVAGGLPAPSARGGDPALDLRSKKMGGGR